MQQKESSMVPFMYGIIAENDNFIDRVEAASQVALLRAASSLLVCDGHQVKSHRGVLALFGDTR